MLYDEDAGIEVPNPRIIKTRYHKTNYIGITIQEDIYDDGSLDYSIFDVICDGYEQYESMPTDVDVETYIREKF